MAERQPETVDGQGAVLIETGGAVGHRAQTQTSGPGELQLRLAQARIDGGTQAQTLTAQGEFVQAVCVPSVFVDGGMAHVLEHAQGQRWMVIPL